MERWQQFEIEACEYLNSVFKDLPFTFKCTGGSNSLAEDIMVYKGKDHIFSIEAKLSPAQGGQFSVIPIESDGKIEYTYSRDNKFSLDGNSESIMKHINQNIGKYSHVTQRGIDIDGIQPVLINWVIGHYKKKRSKFIITSKGIGSFKAIVPTDELKDNFYVHACLRRKRSGPRKVPNYQYELAESLVKRHFGGLGFGIKGFEYDGKGISLTLNSGAKLSKDQRYLPENMYISSDKYDRNRFTIKKRSSTNNINVVFSLEYKYNTSTGLELLRNELLKYS
ncbi:MAG TPA: hypothetical protein PLA01_02270 [Acetivibrio sp.]|nr:hypothetical protein [Acetivibrio sp.]